MNLHFCLLFFIAVHLNSLIKAGKLPETNFPQVDAHVRTKYNSVVHSTPSPTGKQIKSQGVKVLEKNSHENPTKPTDGNEDPLHYLTEIKHDIPNYFSLNPYLNLKQSPYPLALTLPLPIFSTLFQGFSPFSHASKFYPFLNFSPLWPIPFTSNPEMLYATYADTFNFPEDTMSRASGEERHPSSVDPSTNHFSKNSPIYYLRLPPTPYMFLPNFNYPTSSSFSSLLSYPPVSTFHALPMSSMLNLPLNFLGNGKPSGIYRIDGIPNEFNKIPFNFPGTDPNYLSNSYRPFSSSSSTSTSTFFPHQPSTPFEFASNPTTPSSIEPESKLTYLKHPFFFNGRPDDIFILPNNFNPNLFSERSFY